MNTRINVLSGFGSKAAAAILIEIEITSTSKKRFLLDAGGSLEDCAHKGWEFPKDLDAIIITHDHQDHAGGLLDLSDNDQVPVYATPYVISKIHKHLNFRTLPNKGTIDICGITVTTGNNGHSYGGVWLHLGIGGGIFYSGDFSLESELYNFCLPPKSEVALLDASYGLYETSQQSNKERLLKSLSNQKPNLLPVPQTGRALEMAYWFSCVNLDNWVLGDDCLNPSDVYFGDPSLVSSLAYLNMSLMRTRSFNDDASIILCGDPDGFGGDSARLLTHKEKYNILYTGHLPEHARNAVSSSLATFVRWNVHPRTEDLKKLVKYLNCKYAIPLFHNLEPISEWKKQIGDCIYNANTLDFTHETRT
ncbi:MBL fold metallo-hydrolase [Salinispirillum marinum]|uniref:MBL fold metallo-hydrolase n=2 Tax=Saccharospirillaceae TaxID=255527 RepID=A0ABV8BBP1_9GAMM